MNFIKKRHWLIMFLVIVIVAGLFALHLSGEYRYAHVPLRFAIVPRGMPQLGQSVQDLAFSPSGRTLVVADQQTGMSLWSMPLLECDRRFENSVGDNVSSMFWSASKNRFILGDIGGIRQWDVHNGRFLETPIKQVGISAIASKKKWWNGYQRYVISPLGDFAADVDTEGDITVWNTNIGQKCFAIEALPMDRNGYPTDFCDIAFSPDDRSVVTTSLYGDNSVAYAPLDIVIRDCQTGHIVRKWQWKNINMMKIDDGSGGNLGNTGVIFSTDGKLLAIADDGNVAIWDVWTGAIKRNLSAPLPPNSGGYGGKKRLVFFDKDRLLAGIGWGDAVPVWNVETGKLLQAFHADPYTQALAVSPDGKLLATGGQYLNGDGRIELWDVSRFLQ